MESLQRELSSLSKAARLSSAVDEVDKIIELLTSAREQIASEPHTAGVTMAKLQNPMKERFEAVNQDLKDVTKTQRILGKALDRSLPLKPLPTDHDAMADHPALINRAIAMHLLREGQFSVASSFISEAQEIPPPYHQTTFQPFLSKAGSDDVDEPMDGVGGEGSSSSGRRDDSISLQSSLHSQELQAKFAEMYCILQQLRARNLLPAIEWARENSTELESRGSNLEFELSKLQFVWLFKGPSVNGLPDDEHNGRSGALQYGRENFGRFQVRHLKEIQQLASAMVFASNLAGSPYRALFATDTAFADVAASFTREFCSLLGLSAESPLYMAVTAGALALPQLMKYTSAARAKGTEWTTANELAFETPLPERMVYHSIFVCPVSKEQTTESNPPMMIACGHVLARETLQRLCKGSRFKCPYCPSEGHVRDARQIIL